MNDVRARVVDKDDNSLVIEATSELNTKGVCYGEDALRRLVEHNVEERRKNQDILELNKYGARRNYMDEVNKTKSVPHYLIEDFIAYGGETNGQ